MRKVVLILTLVILLLSFVALIFGSLNKKKIESTSNQNSTIATDIPPVLSSKYSEYIKTDYDLALNEKRIVLLYFTSNWCSGCIVQDEINFEVINSLEDKGVAGFRIHTLDSESTIETEALSKKFGISKEQTIVILDKNGAIYFKNVGDIDTETLKNKLMEVIKI